MIKSNHRGNLIEATEKFEYRGFELLRDYCMLCISNFSFSTSSYMCPNPVWACAWNERNCNYVYAGLQNGSCHVYDIRKTNEELKVIRPSVGLTRPIVSLAYVPPGDGNSVLR